MNHNNLHHHHQHQPPSRPIFFNYYYNRCRYHYVTYLIVCYQENFIYSTSCNHSSTFSATIVGRCPNQHSGPTTTFYPPDMTTAIVHGQCRYLQSLQPHAALLNHHRLPWPTLHHTSIHPPRPPPLSIGNRYPPNGHLRSQPPWPTLHHNLLTRHLGKCFQRQTPRGHRARCGRNADRPPPSTTNHYTPSTYFSEFIYMISVIYPPPPRYLYYRCPPPTKYLNNAFSPTGLYWSVRVCPILFNSSGDSALPCQSCTIYLRHHTFFFRVNNSCVPRHAY